MSENAVAVPASEAVDEPSTASARRWWVLVVVCLAQVLGALPWRVVVEET